MPTDRRDTVLVEPGAQLTVDQAYALWSETYDSAPNPLLALEERYLCSMLPSLAGKTVLDLGCGTGRLIERLSSSGTRRYLGVDISSGMLARAANKLHSTSYLVRADCRDLPLSSHCADVVICSFLLGYLNLQELAAEIARVSKRDADLYLSEFHPDTRSLGWKRNFRSGDQVIELPANHCSLPDVKLAFQLHDFECVQMVEPGFGEPEREIFAAHKKSHVFESSRGTPAIFIYHLRRSSRGA